jgi:hypothetical protein
MVMLVPAFILALFAGDVIDTTGFADGETVIRTTADVVVAFRLSVARAVSVCVPAGTLVHEKL